jgi:hypothetical protein
LGEINQRKKLRKVKKKWVIVGTTVVCGLLTPVALRASATVSWFKPLQDFFLGVRRPEFIKTSDSPSLLEQLSGDGYEAAKFSIGQAASMQNQNSLVIVEAIPEAPLPGGSETPVTSQQLEASHIIVNQQSDLQQLLQPAASTPPSTTESTEKRPSLVVVENEKKIIELPSPEDLELKEDLEKTKKEFEEQMAQLNAVKEENQLLSEKIDADAQALSGREERIGELTALVDERQALLEEREQEIAEAENELKDVEVRLEQTENQTERAKLKAKISVLKEDIKQKEVAKKELAQKIEINKKELEKHQKAAAKLKQRMESREEEVENNEQRIDLLTKQLQAQGNGKVDPSVFALTPEESFERLSSMEQELSRLQLELTIPFPPGTSEEDKIRSRQEVEAGIAKLESELSAFKHARPDAVEQKVIKSEEKLAQEHKELEKIERRDKIATNLLRGQGVDIEIYLDKEFYEPSPFNLQILNDDDLEHLKNEYNKLDIGVRKKLNAGNFQVVQKQFAIWEVLTLRKNDEELELNFDNVDYKLKDVNSFLERQDIQNEVTNGNKHPMLLVMEWLAKKKNQGLADYSLGATNVQKHRFSRTDTPKERYDIKELTVNFGMSFKGNEAGRFLYHRADSDASTWSNVLTQTIAGKVQTDEMKKANKLDEKITKITLVTGVDMLPFRPTGLTDDEFHQFIESNLKEIEDNIKAAQQSEKEAVSNSNKQLTDLNNQERYLLNKVKNLGDYIESDIDQIRADLQTAKDKVIKLEQRMSGLPFIKRSLMRPQLISAQEVLENLQEQIAKFGPFELLKASGTDLQEELRKAQDEVKSIADRKESTIRSLEREKVAAHNLYIKALKFIPKNVETVGKMILQLKAAVDKFGVYLGIYKKNRSNEDWLHQLEIWNALPDGVIPAEIQAAIDNENAVKNYIPVPDEGAGITDDPADQQPILNYLRQIRQQFLLPQAAVNTLRGTFTSSQWRDKLNNWLNDYSSTNVPVELQKLIDAGYQVDNDLEDNIRQKLNTFAPLVSLTLNDFEKYALNNSILDRRIWNNAIDGFTNKFNKSMTLPPIPGAAISKIDVEYEIEKKYSITSADNSPVQADLAKIIRGDNNQFDETKQLSLLETLWINIKDTKFSDVLTLGYKHPSQFNSDYVKAMIFAIQNGKDPSTYTKAQYDIDNPQ